MEEEEQRLLLTQAEVALYGLKDTIDGWSILHFHVSFDHILVVKWLVDTYPSLVHEVRKGGVTPLHLATSVPVAQYLLREGKADVFARTERSRRLPSEYTYTVWTPTYLVNVEQRLSYLKMLAPIKELPSELKREVITYLV